MTEPFRPLAILLLAFGLLNGCGPAEPSTEEALRSVRTWTVQSADGRRTRTFTGTSRAVQTSRLSFKVGGTVVALPIEVGQKLRRGDLVARLDPFSYELQAEQSQASLAQAVASERNAAATYARTKDLYADNNASRTDLDSARASAESAEAQVRASQKALELARLNVSYTRLAASTDCSVASIDVEVNENVSTGGTVATVNCGEGLEVSLSIPESLVADLETGMTAQVRFDARPDEVFPGRLTEVGISARQGSTFPATVTLEGDHPELRAGLAAEVRFELAAGSSDGRFLIPLSALVESGGTTYVYLAEAADEPGEGIVTQRVVTVGDLTEDGAEITAGLSVGDRVITAGTSLIRDGLRVLLEESRKG
ncbi:MAG: efflux RND transporter periplasmic adaptor subunit [Acidobacteriota bacterium]